MSSFRLRAVVAATLAAPLCPLLPAMAQGTSPPAAALPDIVVTGQRAAIQRALEMEREANNVVSVVEAEDIGQFADQNVAESIQRLPGITLNRSEGEGRSVTVRGLPSAFTPVTVNGVRLGTSSLNTSAVALDSVSNDQLASIEVAKSVLPSMDADTIGGAVNLTTLSAFSRPDAEVQFRAEGYYGDLADDWGTRLAVNATRRLADDRFGVAASLSYSNRPIYGVEVESGEGLDRVAAAGTSEPRFYRPEEFDVIFETGERTRWNAALNLEYRPTEASELFLRGTWSRLNDEDVSYRDIVDLSSSSGSDVVAVRPGGGRFDDVDLIKRLFFQDITDSIWSLSSGGRLEYGSWTTRAQVDYSKSRFSNPEALRGRFRERDLIFDLDFGKEDFVGTFAPGVRGSRGDPAVPANYEFNQLLYVQEFRNDEVIAGKLDFTREADWFAGGAFDFGVQYRTREKDNDRTEAVGNPESVDFDRTLADVPLFEQASGFGYTSFYPQLDPSLALFREARDALRASPTFLRNDLSNSGDFVLEEDVTAAYVQATLDFTPQVRLIAGVRMERTETASTGFYTEFDGSGIGVGGAPGVVLALDPVEASYTDWFPGAHLRWTPSEQWVVRASYSRGLQRPDFDDRRNLLRVQFETDDPTDRDLFAGNPFLEPLIANQFDVGAAWYPSDDLHFQATAFYKDITNFFVGFSGDGAALGQLPIRLPAGVDPAFDRISTTLNGDDARVVGIELGYYQAFRALPGALSGLFAQANVTYADSESSASVRAGEKFSLPEQRDVVANLSLGWENPRFSVRVAANYQGEALAALAGSPDEDVYVDPGIWVDLNLRWQFADGFQAYFDAINLTEEAEIQYYRGDAAGRIFETNSAFGRTFQVGLRATF